MYAEQLGRWKAKERNEAKDFYDAGQLNEASPSNSQNFNQWVQSLDTAATGSKYGNVGIDNLIQEQGTAWIDK